MSIKKYTNFENINSKIENEGKFLKEEDLFIVSKNEIEDTEFGDCKYDVMEVSVYDVNNNLLPQKTGNNVSYIKKREIKNYMYSIVNAGGQKEIAINVELLLNDLGFTNGILKVNINFVRNKVGSDNELTRVWIQEISPSREEIRILPLKSKDDYITDLNKREFYNLKNLNKDFKYYKKSLLDSLSAFENNFLTRVDDYLTSTYGSDFFNVLRVDFGLSRFEDFRQKIFKDYKESVTNYLTNKYYTVGDTNFGQPSETRFEDCERYDFYTILSDLESILSHCIRHNSSFLKRRDIKIKTLPKEFQKVELTKQLQDNLDSFQTFTETKRNIYNPSKIDFKLDDKSTSEPIYGKATNITIISDDQPPPFIPTPIEVDPPPPPIYASPTEEIITPILPPDTIIDYPYPIDPIAIEPTPINRNTFIIPGDVIIDSPPIYTPYYPPAYEPIEVPPNYISYINPMDVYTGITYTPPDANIGVQTYTPTYTPTNTGGGGVGYVNTYTFNSDVFNISQDIQYGYPTQTFMSLNIE